MQISALWLLSGSSWVRILPCRYPCLRYRPSVFGSGGRSGRGFAVRHRSAHCPAGAEGANPRFPPLKPKVDSVQPGTDEPGADRERQRAEGQRGPGIGLEEDVPAQKGQGRAYPYGDELP